MSVRAMCRLLEVAASGFYAWCTRPPSARTIANQTLTEIIQAISGFRYGSRRIRQAYASRRAGWPPSRLPPDAECQPPPAPHEMAAADDRACGASAAPNQLKRQFAVTAPHACWVGAITAIPLRSGTAYLAGVLDRYTRKVVGWTLGRWP